MKWKIAKSREDLNTKILGQSGRQNARTEITMDERLIKGFLADAWNDIGYLQNHWSILSASERDLATRAKFDLGDLE